MWDAKHRQGTAATREYFASVFTSRSGDMVDRVEATWMGMLLFPAVLWLVDPSCHPQIMRAGGPWRFAKNLKLVAVYIFFPIVVFYSFFQ